MAALEMGVYPAASQPLIGLGAEFQEKVSTAFGDVTVTLYGEIKNAAECQSIITFHDIGLNSEFNFQHFFLYGPFAEFLADHFVVYNINAPGQEMSAQLLPEDFVYPTMDGLASVVSSVVEHFEIKNFLGLGVGAGANVLMRYALRNEKKIDGLVLINLVARTEGWVEWFFHTMGGRNMGYYGMTRVTVDNLIYHHFGKHLEECDQDVLQQYRSYFMRYPYPHNLGLFFDSYRTRSDLAFSRDGNYGPCPSFPVLQIVGSRSAYVDDSVDVNSRLDPSKSDWLKVSDSCGLVLDDKPEKATQAILLFFEGLGIRTNIARLRQLTKKIQIAEGQNQSEGNDDGDGAEKEKATIESVETVAETFD